ncbi:unnamed protein product [Cyclocybe aegerita]|uniref:EthD domain-containing protein n=1 Tax=Cyclocybe aegerita TaxID=1973307 RepID=A0A8S0VUJ1_CYCAE|nr:unnamed protein product [Cyclocybe aegerita]
MPRGFLAVTSRPSSLLPESEFHDWYEGEHIPLRLDRLHEFLSGARYRAVDTSVSPSDATPYGPTHPEWLAMYEIDDTATFSKPAYTSLREQRSAREADVMKRLAVLVRRTGEEVGAWTQEEGGEGGIKTTGMKPGKPSGWVITHGLKAGDEEARKWAEGVVAQLNTVPGWASTRLVHVLESGETRLGGPHTHPEGKGILPYFVIHECPEEASMRAVRQAISDHGKASEQSQVEVGEWREWALYKAYPCIAHQDK